MMSKLNIVIRDATYPCKPYESTQHSFWVAVFHCDLKLFKIQPLTEPGPTGGKIYGEVEVPPGSYLVVGFSYCKNVMTNWAFAVAGCGQHVCVGLIPRRFEQCCGELRLAIKAALTAAAGTYPYSSPPRKIAEIEPALEKALSALENLGEYLPEYELPLSPEDLKRADAPRELLELWAAFQKKG